MSITILDAREWQTMLDLRTGEKVEKNGILIDMVKDLLQRHPYPGDMDRASNRWVTDTALDLMRNYEPRFVFLTYAAQYFSGRYNKMSEKQRSKAIAEAFTEAGRFIDVSGFTGIVMGTGNMTTLRGVIDVTEIDGLAIATHWSARYAGLHGPSPDDLKALKDNTQIEGIIPRDEVCRLFNATPEQAVRVPEYLMLAREGLAFRTISGAMKKPVMIPSLNFAIPLYAPGENIENITDIKGLLERSLANQKVALIVIEGVGLGEFPWPHVLCRNGKEWFYYEPGDAQYLTISSGKDRFYDYPTGYKYFDEVDSSREYPFSGYFT